MPAPSPRARRGVGGVLVDTGPLRRHPGFRRLWTGQLVASLGSQLTVVAVAYQTYLLTGSTAMVGLVSLSGLVPLLAGSVLGGPAVDAWDRRKVMLVTQVLLAVGAAGLAVNAMLGHPLLWPMFACTAESALFQSVDWAARRASLRRPATRLPRQSWVTGRRGNWWRTALRSRSSSCHRLSGPCTRPTRRAVPRANRAPPRSVRSRDRPNRAGPRTARLQRRDRTRRDGACASRRSPSQSAARP